MSFVNVCVGCDVLSVDCDSASSASLVVSCWIYDSIASRVPYLSSRTRCEARFEASSASLVSAAGGKHLCGFSGPLFRQQFGLYVSPTRQAASTCAASCARILTVASLASAVHERAHQVPLPGPPPHTRARAPPQKPHTRVCGRTQAERTKFLSQVCTTTTMQHMRTHARTHKHTRGGGGGERGEARGGKGGGGGVKPRDCLERVYRSGSPGGVQASSASGGTSSFRGAHGLGVPGRVQGYPARGEEPGRVAGRAPSSSPRGALPGRVQE